MAKRRRIDIRGILANPDLRRELMVPTLQATQAREGVDTTREQAERAYYVVTEAERAAFFDLAQFRGGKGESDRRHEMFIRALRDEVPVRVDIARRDFAAIEGAPLAYQRLGILAPIFRQWPSLKSTFGVVQRGAPTAEDERLVRFYWEVAHTSAKHDRSWEPFSKGGSFSRFYYDVSLRVAWDPMRRSFHKWYGRKGRPIERPESLDNFFLPSITWPMRTQRGFSVRYTTDAVFSHKSGFVQPTRAHDIWFALGLLNSAFVEFVLSGLVSFGSYEVGAVQRIPVALPAQEQHKRIGTNSEFIWQAKASWDEGNETSTRFRAPWLLRDDLVDARTGIPARLDRLADREAAEEVRIRKLYAELNDEVYKLYGVPGSTRVIIEKALDERPPEVLWPQMEHRSIEQKRMEHVWRLLSYAVKRLQEANAGGIAAFGAVAGEPALIDRVRQELAELFPGLDANQVEVDIANELKRTVKGYRRCASVGEWLDNTFFEFHCGLYKSRPIFWHIASAQGTSAFAFGALVHYHRFDKNGMAKLRGSYVRDAIEDLRREAALADKAGRTDDRLEWQARVEETQTLDRKLQWIQEGHHEPPDGGDRDYRILTPWEEPRERSKGWNPDLDDGVKVNIQPFEKAGVLRAAKVTG